MSSPRRSRCASPRAYRCGEDGIAGTVWMALFQEDPRWRDYLLFCEYFHGDNGAGLGGAFTRGMSRVS
jgi:hypothetical protein